MARPRHKIPTHLKVTDKVLLLPVLGIGMTARQFLILLIGGSTSYSLWLHLFWMEHWYTPFGSLLHWITVLLIACATLALALAHVEGRPLEEWLVVLLFYWRMPRVYVWRSVRIIEESDTLKRQDVLLQAGRDEGGRSW